MSTVEMRSDRPIAPAYAPRRHPAPTDLDLSGVASFAEERLVRYPDARAVEARLALRFGVSASRVLVTAGADDALDRVCRATLGPGRNAVVATPTFEMIPRYIVSAGGQMHTVAWSSGAYPVDEAIAAADRETALAVVVTPNNPTGTIATADEIRRLHDAIPQALIAVDLAYVEFAAADPTAALLELPRVIIVRTFSKAWAMPDVRVGFALGGADVVAALRGAGGPFPVAAASLREVDAALDRGDKVVRARADTVRRHRIAFEARLNARGTLALPSEAGFACVTGPRGEWLHDALASLGIATRILADGEVTRVRITVPPDDSVFSRLLEATATALAPEAILFDMDGVVADVTGSYRRAIHAAAAEFGVALGDDSIASRKATGNANDDWALAAELIAAAGVACTLPAVTEAFERAYQGDGIREGLREREVLLVRSEWLRNLALRLPIGIVTGRPRADAERFLARFGLLDAFRVIVAREDAPLKPSPEPVRLALKALGVRRAWLLGDTPDDIAAARGAGVVPVGVAPPGDHAMREALGKAGASRVVTNAMEIAPCHP